MSEMKKILKYSKWLIIKTNIRFHNIGYCNSCLITLFSIFLGFISQYNIALENISLSINPNEINDFYSFTCTSLCGQCYYIFALEFIIINVFKQRGRIFYCLCVCSILSMISLCLYNFVRSIFSYQHSSLVTLSYQNKEEIF